MRWSLLALLGLAMPGCTSPSEPTPPTAAEGQLLVNTSGNAVAVVDMLTGVMSPVPGVIGTTARFLGDAPFAVVGGGTTIGRVDLVSGAATTLYTVPAGQSVSTIAVSPDGSRIAFVTRNAFGDGKSTIQLLSVATGAIVAAGSARFESLNDLRWFPDGQRLLVQAYDGADAELVRLDLRAAGTVAVDTVPGARSRLPGGFTLSPDGRRLVLARWTPGGATSGDHFALVELDLATSGPAVDLGAHGDTPVFGPSTAWVVFTTRNERALRLLRRSDRSISELPGAIGAATGTLPLDWRRAVGSLSGVPLPGDQNPADNLVALSTSFRH